jgi:hypothetical protein
VIPKAQFMAMVRIKGEERCGLFFLSTGKRENEEQGFT